MAYTPPTSPLNGSWVGAPAYGRPIGRALGSWHGATTQHIYQPIGFDAAALGAAVLKWPLVIAPPGLESLAFGETLAALEGQYVRPQFILAASWNGALAYAPSRGALGVTWNTSVAYLAPEAIQPPDVSEPVLVQQQFISPSGDDFSLYGTNHYALFEWQYPPPQGAVNASWVGKDEYSPATGTLNAAWALPAEAKQVSLTGWESAMFGATALPVVGPDGFVASLVPNPTIVNTAAPLLVAGFDALAFGQARIWNWRQYATPPGFPAQLFGTSAVLGGVKYITPAGLSAFASGTHTVINTTANQEAKPEGIAVPLSQVPGPNVSPRSLWPTGIYGTIPGFPVVQFPPQPQGWESTAFGYPVIEYKTKLVKPAGLSSFAEGFPAIRDAARTVLHQSSDVTALFGDVRVRLVNAFVRPAGWDSAELVDWAIVYSTSRWVLAQGFDATGWADPTIRNKTPSFAPVGFDSQNWGAHDVGWRVREVRADGVPAPLNAVPEPSLWQTPGIKPAGISAPAVPAPTIWPGIRTVEAKGSEMLRMGDEPAVGFSWRPVPVQGFDASAYGNAARIENANRAVAAFGSSFMAFGTAWATDAVRVLAPKGIDYPPMHRHQIGGARWLYPEGWESTRWLTRIIPEQQEIFPKSFTAEVGWPAVGNHNRYIPLEGITTYPEDSMRYGVARVWNLRQVITQFEDLDSGLAPPAWPDWTLIENRNKVFGAEGFVATRYGAALVENKARPLLPAGVEAPALPEWQAAGSVTHGIRYLPLQGLEPPLVPEWLVVWNKAFPLKPGGLVATEFGQTEVVNLRRFRSVQGFEAHVFGYPMVADAIREVSFDPRYAIQPPRIELPEVKLHTRYVEPKGIGDPQYGSWFGAPELTIHWTTITPRWTNRDEFGEPALRNVTPELATRGRAADEWGNTFVRLEWRPMEPVGSSMQLFGLTRIADRKQTITVAGRNFLTVSDKLVVIRPGEDPVATQYIELRKFSRQPDGALQEQQEGYGIPDDNGSFFKSQVPTPDLMKGYVFHLQSSEATLWGTAELKANSIRVEPGVGWDFMDQPVVTYKNRVITVPTIGQQVIDARDYYDLGSWGRPALSPHTIYAVNNAPEQAVKNHSNRNEIPYVNTGIKTGRPEVGGSIRYLYPTGITDRDEVRGTWGVGSPSAINWLQTVQPTGVNLMRMGWLTIPGTQYISDAEFDDVSPFGLHEVTFGPDRGPYFLRPQGFIGWIGEALVQNQNRVLPLSGFDSMSMGTGIFGDSPYQWQGLRVGPLIPTIPDGFAADSAGEPWVSLRIRGVAVEGFDSFALDYDDQDFDKRMKVRRIDPYVSPMQIKPYGWVDGHAAAPSTNRMRHYIRPDGNSDQFRKGVPA